MEKEIEAQLLQDQEKVALLGKARVTYFGRGRMVCGG